MIYNKLWKIYIRKIKCTFIVVKKNKQTDLELKARVTMEKYKAKCLPSTKDYKLINLYG